MDKSISFHRNTCNMGIGQLEHLKIRRPSWHTRRRTISSSWLDLSISNCHIFKVKRVFPIIKKHYSKKHLVILETSLYLCNNCLLAQFYPGCCVVILTHQVLILKRKCRQSNIVRSLAFLLVTYPGCSRGHLFICSETLHILLSL